MSEELKKKFGHYEVVSELGRGGMGVVYKAWEPSLNRHVAIKALGEHLLGDEGLIERFTREAKSMAAINHPNVIQVYFIGMEANQPYFAMEFIEGVSLDDLLRGNKVLTVSHAKEILRQACAGLAIAHDRDLVHRDIKPANLMLCDDGTVKVVDFGIAQTREYGDKLTNTGEFVGTPGYLSPEVCTGNDVDARSDIFALGIVFYEMLAGKVPFENDSPLGLMLEVVQADIPDIRAINKKVDKKTSYILQKMIAKNPEERFQSCQEVIKHLGPSSIELSLADITSQAISVKPEKKAPSVSQQVTLPNASTIDTVVPKSHKKSNKAVWGVLALAVAVGLGAVGMHEGYIPSPFDNSDKQAMTLLSDDSKQDMELADVNLKSPEELAAINNEMNQKNNSAATTTTADNSSASTDAVTQQASDMTAADRMTDTTAANPAVNSANENLVASVPASSNQVTGSDQALAANQTTTPQQTTDQVIQQPVINNEKIEQAQATITQATLAAVDNSSKTVTNNLDEFVEKQTKPVIRKPKVVKKDKGIAVLVFGDPAVANPIEKILEAELKRDNIKVLNEQFVPGLSQVMAQGVDLAAIKTKLDAYGGEAMIIANVNYVGEQTLEYYGRQSQLVNAQLDIDSYDLATGDSIGNGYGSQLSYTSLNATETAQDAVMEFVDRLKQDLKNKQ
ncbi:protein kinase [Marinicella sp. S1101]|uniref:serine/threonine-protein kinase n=1 Tax=Marinicella marina TaxID=2996016 RepID=UPI0022609A25|nr:serine/threonine-protein kinase [Marinicella marina]MCX7553295.1 protein kinase [Marinicella marina]MDJ1139027.1 protein kinase [Marinicella marina]